MDMDDFENLNEKIISQSKELEALDQAKADELLEILLNTREQGQMMEQLIKNQIQVKDEMISKLHKELDYYKQDSTDRFVDQLMKSVIKVRKDMNKRISSEAWDRMTLADLKREYQYVLEDITDLLEQQNVDAYESNPGDDFDASIHQAKLEATNDINLDKKIKGSISEGYKKRGKVLIPERVIVYQYKA
jgi:molecular chaperone GrpE (heat shock protein)